MNKIYTSNASFWSNPVTVILLSTLLYASSKALGIIFVNPIMPLIKNTNLVFLMLSIGGLLALFSLLYFIISKFGISKKAIGITLPRGRYIAYIPLFFIGYFIISALSIVVVQYFFSGFNISETQDIGLADVATRIDLIAIFVSLTILTPIFEEVIFRGILYNGLRRKLNLPLAVIVASLLFALSHLQWNVGIDTFALSIMLCLVTEKSNSILPAILLHALKNGIAYILIFIL